MPSWIDGSIPEQRILEASLRLSPEGAVTGWAGLRLFGGGFFDGLMADGLTPLPVPLCVGQRARLRADDRVVLLRDRLDRDELLRRHGISCVTALRAAFDAARTATDLREAVVAIDMAAAATITSPHRLHAYVASHPGWNGVPTVRAALDLASDDSRSPNETRMRLVWLIDAGLPTPLVNQPVYDLRGRLLGIADLLDLEAGVAGEFDGAEHRRAARHSRDVQREDRFRRHGLEVFRVTGPDLSRRTFVAQRMLAARERARWEDPASRRWTIEDPWQDGPGQSLDDLLDHRDLMAELHALHNPVPDLPRAGRSD